MFYGIASGNVDTGDYEFEHVLSDIQTLNEWAREGKLEVTAISLHAYAHVHDKYALLPNGCSMGNRYGPILVAREAIEPSTLRGQKIAVPGLMTTAFLTLSLYLREFEPLVVPFDEIMDVVRRGDAVAGCVIHEGQLTYAEHGLHKILDLGKWWYQAEGLPLPLGVDVVRRDLGEGTCRELARILGEGIEYAMSHRPAALDYARQFGRGLDPERTDRFVQMYVNEDTLDYGPRGREAVRHLLRKGHEAGLLPGPIEVDFVEHPARR
jgi:1,4-dihydroxy-6-naphthoate synthase